MKDRTSQDAKNWEKVACDYIKFINREKSTYLKYLIYESLFSNILDLIGDIKGKTVLDAGCGEGRLSRLLTDRGGIVFGCDVSPTMIEEARLIELKEPHGIDYFVQDLTEEVSGGRRYDTIVSNLVLFNIYNLNGAIANISRRLNKGGRFIFSLLHPCFNVTKSQWYNLRFIGRRGGRIVFDINKSYKDQNLYKKGHLFKSGRVNFYHRPIESYFRSLGDNGFLVDALTEPVLKLDQIADEKTYHHYFLPRFMIIRAVK